MLVLLLLEQEVVETAHVWYDLDIDQFVHVQSLEELLQLSLGLKILVLAWHRLEYYCVVSKIELFGVCIVSIGFGCFGYEVNLLLHADSEQKDK